MATLRYTVVLAVGFAITFTLIGCATVRQNINASEYLLSTDRSTTNLLHDLAKKLAEYDYKIAIEDDNSGMLATGPREFKYTSNGRQISARQTVLMRQEGGSLLVRLDYDCNYNGDDIQYSQCFSDDKGAVNKISIINRSFIATIKPLLSKHPGLAESDDTTAPPKTSAQN